MLVPLSGVQRTAVSEASREQIECLLDYPGLRSTLLEVALLDVADAASVGSDAGRIRHDESRYSVRRRFDFFTKEFIHATCHPLCGPVRQLLGNLPSQRFTTRRNLHQHKELRHAARKFLNQLDRQRR